MPLPQGPCRECDVLWLDFAQGEAEHVKLLADSQRAAENSDPVEALHIDAMIREAGARRTQLRDAIRVHEATAHPDAGAA